MTYWSWSMGDKTLSPKLTRRLLSEDFRFPVLNPLELFNVLLGVVAKFAAPPENFAEPNESSIEVSLSIVPGLLLRLLVRFPSPDFLDDFLPDSPGVEYLDSNRLID